MMDFIVEPNAERGADVVAVHRCKVATFVERFAAEAYADWRRTEGAALDQRAAVWLTGGKGASMSPGWDAMTRAETGVGAAECCDRCGDPIIEGLWCAGCDPSAETTEDEMKAEIGAEEAAEDVLDAPVEAMWLQVDPPRQAVDAAAGDAPLPEAVAHLVSASPTDPYAPDGEAMRRLQAGDKVNVVADELGLNPHRLRGHWSRRQVAQRDAAAPSRDRPVMDDAVPPTRAQPPKLAAPAAPATQPAEGWVVCRRCKVEFNAAKAQKLHKLDEQPTLCAACRAVAA